MQKFIDFLAKYLQDIIVISLIVHFHEIWEWQGWAWLISYSIAASLHDWILVEEA